MEFQELVLRSSRLEVTLLPGIGGKVRQIVDRKTGDPLLVSPTKPYQQIQVGNPWTDYDTSGMDDCFPNIEPGSYPFPGLLGEPLFQMGEWVYGAWDVSQADNETVVLERKGTRFNYLARKTYRLVDSDTLEIQYEVRNLAAAPFRYLWSAHPLFAVKDEFELQLPNDGINFKVFPGPGEFRPWPAYDSGDLSKEWIPRGRTLKTFLIGLRKGQCRLKFPHHTISITFDLKTTPILGVWFNNFGFPKVGSPFRCIAIEPCTTASDSLEQLEANAYPLMEPHNSNHWWLKIKIT
jgi:hypothetical protein